MRERARAQVLASDKRSWAALKKQPHGAQAALAALAPPAGGPGTAAAALSLSALNDHGFLAALRLAPAAALRAALPPGEQIAELAVRHAQGTRARANLFAIRAR